MERVNGITLEKGLFGTYDDELKEKIRTSLAGVETDELMREIDLFFDTMHTVCLHNAVKADNIMISEEGKLYVIDFGDARPMHDLDDQENKNIETLKEDEKTKTKMLVGQFIRSLA